MTTTVTATCECGKEVVCVKEGGDFAIWGLAVCPNCGMTYTAHDMFNLMGGVEKK